MLYLTCLLVLTLSLSLAPVNCQYSPGGAKCSRPPCPPIWFWGTGPQKLYAQVT